jgi:hypothetical protein
MARKKATRAKSVIDSRVAAADASAGADDSCTITLTISPDDGQPNFHRAARLETGRYLAFSGDTTTAVVPAGAHALTWWAAGDVEEHFSVSLAGDVDKERKQGGRIPPARITSGIVDFVAVKK